LEVEKWSTIWIDNPAIAEGLVNNPGFEGGGFSGGGDSSGGGFGGYQLHILVVANDGGHDGVPRQCLWHRLAVEV